MPAPTVTVAIPTKNAGPDFPGLLDRIRAQSLRPNQITVVDSGSTDETVATAERFGCSIIQIPPSSFNHGGTRNLCWRSAATEVVVFTVQDASPDVHWLARCVERFQEHPKIAAVGCRQVPIAGGLRADGASRRTMYPEHSSLRTPATLDDVGLSALLLSNAAAGYRRSALEAVGGFSEHLIVAEDMEIAYRLLRAGHWIAYAADSVVTHSHSYRTLDQVRRNFDLGVFFATNPEIAALGSTGAFARLARDLVRNGLAGASTRERLGIMVDAAARATGLTLGRRYRILPSAVRRRLTRTPSFWLRHEQ